MWLFLSFACCKQLCPISPLVVWIGVAPPPLWDFSLVLQQSEIGLRCLSQGRIPIEAFTIKFGRYVLSGIEPTRLRALN